VTAADACRKARADPSSRPGSGNFRLASQGEAPASEGLACAAGSSCNGFARTSGERSLYLGRVPAWPSAPHPTVPFTLVLLMGPSIGACLATVGVGLAGGYWNEHGPSDGGSGGPGGGGGGFRPAPAPPGGVSESPRRGATRASPAPARVRPRESADQPVPLRLLCR
jgi:hypothetical protein